jgi:hypothetical protein
MTGFWLPTLQDYSPEDHETEQADLDCRRVVADRPDANGSKVPHDDYTVCGVSRKRFEAVLRKTKWVWLGSLLPLLRRRYVYIRETWTAVRCSYRVEDP